MKQFTFLPWDLRSWRMAFRLSGLSGWAMLALLLADLLQMPDNSGAPVAHAGATTIWMIRAPFTFIAALLVLSHPSIPRLSLRDLRFWFLIYSIFFSLSLAWSTSRFGTAGKSLELLIAILIVLHASRDGATLQRLEGIYRLTLLLVAFLATVTVFGYLSGGDVFVSQKPGIFSQTTAESPFLSGNGLGYLSTSLLLVVFAEWEFGNLRLRKALPQFALAATVFIFSSSRTSLAIILLGVCVLLLRKSKIILITFCCATGSLFFLYAGKIFKYLSFNEASSNIDTLSGRTVMWEAAFRDWLQHPILGYGGGVGGKYVLSRISNLSLAKMSSLHSGIMECLSGLGAVGLLLGIGMLVAVSVKVKSAWKRYPEYSGLYIWIISFWIMSVMSIGVLAWMGYPIAIYLILMAHLDAVRRDQVLASRSSLRQGSCSDSRYVECV